MDFANFEEFWKALGRLYDSTLKSTEDIHVLREAAKEDREFARDLREACDASGECRRSAPRMMAASY